MGGTPASCSRSHELKCRSWDWLSSYFALFLGSPQACPKILPQVSSDCFVLHFFRNYQIDQSCMPLVWYIATVTEWTTNKKYVTRRWHNLLEVTQIPLGAFAKLWKATIRSIMSVRSSCKTSAPTGQIFIKFDIFVIYFHSNLAPDKRYAWMLLRERGHLSKCLHNSL